MSNFSKVKNEFNVSFSVANLPLITKEKWNSGVFDSTINYRMSLIREEMNELEEAVQTKNIVEMVDALTDILYVVYGAYTAIGVDADVAFDIVHKSNMSKLCVSETQAKETVDHYKTDYRYDSPVYKISSDNKNFIVYNQSSGKILKSIEYTPAKFDKIL